MALAGFLCFSLLYATQPLLPQLTGEFGVSPAIASLSVSASTAAMAFLLIPLSLISDRFGRHGQMRLCLLGAAIFSLLSALTVEFSTLLLTRIGVGACVAGVPAAAMAYLGEELAPEQRSRAMGLYIAANALGGMSGRFIAAGVSEYWGWHSGLGALGIMGLTGTVAFILLLPPGRHFSPQPLSLRPLLGDIRRIYSDPGLPRLFWIAFMIMGAFVGLYNYLGFRLSLPPYDFSPAAIGGVFLLYLVGSASSVWAGHQSRRYGYPRLMLAMAGLMLAGIALTAATPLPFILGGLALFTFGYFALHALASAWVGQRAGPRRGLVSALYLSSYYLGGSVIGSATGWPWQHFQWPGVMTALCLPVILTALLLLPLRRLSGAS